MELTEYRDLPPTIVSREFAENEEARRLRALIDEANALAQELCGIPPMMLGKDA